MTKSQSSENLDEALENLASEASEFQEPKLIVVVFAQGKKFAYHRDLVTLDLHGPELVVRLKRTKDPVARFYGTWAYEIVEGEPK